MEYYPLKFFGLKRQLPVTHISASKKIANFNLLGDIEFADKACEEIEKLLQKENVSPDCFATAGTDMIPLITTLAKTHHHKRYVILRKSIRNYMIAPEVKQPWQTAPKHAKKLVLNGLDKEYLQGKTVALIDDVVSTGTTMEMASQLLTEAGAKVIAKCALFKQGDRQVDDLLFLITLPIIEVSPPTDLLLTN